MLEQAKAIYFSALHSVQPKNLINDKLQIQKDMLSINNHSFDLSAFKNIYVIGFGKASAYMAQALEDRIGKYISAGCVNVKYGHSVHCNKILIKEAGHPLPDENTLANSHEIIKLAKKANENDLVIVLISGGGSSLLESLPAEIHLSDLQNLSANLISCGADISEINTVRKHISRIKGGHLAQLIYPAKCLSLIISDVIADELDSIASGPTAADNSTYGEALDILKKYKLENLVTPHLMSYLQAGQAGKLPETINSESIIWKNVFNIVLGNNALALHAAKEKAKSLGFAITSLKPNMHGEAKTAASVISAEIISLADSGSPECLLYGGETTVTIKGKGKGGRNQELALAALVQLKNFNRPYVFLSAGTDGTDGPTDATGAFITNDTWKTVQAQKLNPTEYLANNDSYHFFEKVDSLLKTGPTGTNVMDLVIVLLK